MTVTLPFTASNGVTIDRDLEGDLAASSGQYLGKDAEQAFRELFAAQHPNAHGLHRDSRFPEYIFIRQHRSDDGDGRAVGVIDLEQKEFFTAWENLNRDSRERWIIAGHAWLDANPDPAPWMDAKPGEVWRLTTKSEQSNENAWRLESGAFMFDDGGFVLADEIVAGERIWPKADA
ncbi:hypothetical protein SK224_08075 [Microbacterium sp. BG28]|uniref:hypothetical protein n=1 Tax=Microbacterium sp. BG28 TaxID=3097356 RepID=UPI002A5A5BEC|nr:hypothetical protein [Microbacterium sp. BG28]MDY0829084.1 hypothetical protein [Microbacterium sp. BG28]